MTLPITQTASLSSYNGGSQLEVNNSYDTSGMLTSSKQTDGNTILESTTNIYNGSEEVTSTATQDGSGNVIASVTYGYDETSPLGTSSIPQHLAATGTRGNQTSSHVHLATSTIDSTTKYYDTGMPVSVTTPNGTKQYGYDPTQTFVTQTVLPMPSSGVSLTTSANYDPQSGVQISATGMNSGQTAQVIQYDPLLRPTSIYLPNGGKAAFSYSPNETVISSTIDSSRSSIQETFYDGYGRTTRTAVYNGSEWYLTDFCYLPTGYLLYKSIPYSSSSDTSGHVCSGISYRYDALGRVTQMVRPDGSTVAKTYFSRAVEVRNAPGPSKIVQSNLLGMTTAICEISSNASMPGSGAPQACGLDIAGTGFLTSYSYDLANHKTTVTQGVQTRTFQTDAAGRPIYANEPERGVTTYSYAYNSTGLVVTRQRPQANQGSSGVFTTTTTQYDSVGRSISVAYNDGVTPTKYYFYDMATGWNGLNLGESKGQLTYAWTSQSGSTLTGTQLAYDSIGNVVQSVQCLPNRCGNSTFNVNQLYSYDLNSNLTKSTYFTQANTNGEVDTNYTVNIAGQMTSISNTLTGTTNYSGAVLSNIQDGPHGPTSYQYGNGLTGNSIYDVMGRLTGKNVSCGSAGPPQYCSIDSYPYSMTSTIQGSEIIRLYDSSLERNLTMSYDEFGRLKSAVDTSRNISDTYSYDRWGNRWTQNVSNYEGNSPQLAFNTATNQMIGATYDAAGNLINDGLHSYKYDAEGNLLAVGAGATSDIYDAFNNRVQSSGSGTTYQYAFNPQGQRVSEWQPSSSTPTMVEAVTYWNGQPVAYYDGTGTSFIHQDALGTKRAETDYRYVVGFFGDNVSTYTSLPFGDGYGDGYGNGGIDGDAMHFALLDHDSASGTEHAQFRQYNSTWGQWMSPDPYDGSYKLGTPQSFNRYTYALNNPLVKVDRLGLDQPDDSWTDGDGGGGEVVTAGMVAAGMVAAGMVLLPVL
jgi:RHS repeat-associated protein